MRQSALRLSGFTVDLLPRHRTRLSGKFWPWSNFRFTIRPPLPKAVFGRQSGKLFWKTLGPCSSEASAEPTERVFAFIVDILDLVFVFIFDPLLSGSVDRTAVGHRSDLSP
jgi:hypothetical protein